MKPKLLLISFENITRIHLLLHIIQTTVITIRDDGLRLFLELLQIVDDKRAEEGATVLKRRPWLRVKTKGCYFFSIILHV